MIYVKLLSALSICDTWPAFLVMNSSYMPSHFGGIDRIWPAVTRRCGRLGAGFVAFAGIASASCVCSLRVPSRRLVSSLDGPEPVSFCTSIACRCNCSCDSGLLLRRPALVCFASRLLCSLVVAEHHVEAAIGDWRLFRCLLFVDGKLRFQLCGTRSNDTGR